MTREERENSLHCLKVMVEEANCEDCKLYGTTGTDHCERDCVRNAIEALEQEPCEDYISRQALLKLIGEEPFNWTDSDKELQAVEDYRNFRNIVEQLPSVTPQKIGHWIADVDKWGDVVTTVNGYRCNKCNTFNADKDNYCPYCGAKMFEPKESEEEE